jgi:hypothetical protein
MAVLRWRSHQTGTDSPKEGAVRIGAAVLVFAGALILYAMRAQAHAAGSLVASGRLDNGPVHVALGTETGPQAAIMRVPIDKSNTLNPTGEALSTRELSTVAQHFSDSLTPELYDNFQLFLYVNKAETGPWAQRMFVFQKESDGSLVLAGDWPVSTGRERIEYNNAGKELPSFTPQGYYELDSNRMFASYTSTQWGEPMPYAMFFQWKNAGKLTGLAIHAATDDEVTQLGTRASAGCVRLHPQAARDLFNMIKSRPLEPVPTFDTDPASGTTNNDGSFLHKPDGSLVLADGYKVLVVIENYGGDNAVASVQ